MGQVTGLPKTQATRLLKLARDKKARDAAGLFLLEGEKLLREAIERPGVRVDSLVVAQTYLMKGDQGLLRRLVAHPAPLYLCSDPLFDRLSDVRTAAGLLAIVAKPRWDEAALLQQTPLLGVYGDRLQDPTNVGTIIRAAVAFGVQGLWLSPDSVDPFNPKVVRASAGAVLALPVFTLPRLARLTEAGCRLLAAEAQPTGRDLRSVTTLPPRAILVLGNESQGLSAEVLRHADVAFHIPIRPSVESLNVATAAAICLFHLRGLPLDRAGRAVRPRR